MYQLANNVLGKLKYQITGGDLSFVVEPLAGTSFGLPPAPTDAAGGTYGKPYGIAVLADRLDLSQAKYEIIIYSARAAEAGGAFTYTVPAGGRGWEGSTAQGWNPGVGPVYVVQVPTVDVLALKTSSAIWRGQHLAVHNRSLMTWDGTSFKFSRFRISGVGRGKHFNAVGYLDIGMPANGSTVKGHGGAADHVVAGGVIAIPAYYALYYEPSIAAAAETSIDANFRLVSVTADFVAPEHWILIAHHAEVSVAGEYALRVCNGITLYAWRDFAADVGFLNSWVNFGGGFLNASFQKSADGWVSFRGRIKSGTAATIGNALPAGYRPANTQMFPVSAAGAYGEVLVNETGGFQLNVGANTSVFLDTIRYQAAN